MAAPANQPPPALPSLRFQVTATMVTRFAELTGDHSSLHTNAAFARRSQYRENVVHGYLPLLFLATLPLDKVLGGRFSFQKLTASFLKPVYAGDHLIIEVTDLSSTADGSAELEFTVTHAETGTLITTGSAAVTLADAATQNQATASKASLVDPLIEHHRSLDQINKGDLCEFTFVPTRVSLQSLFEIIALGTTGNNWSTGCDALNLLAGSLFSTMVGMCQPGRSATFLNFDVAFAKPFRLDQTYRCQSVVAFKSPTTLTMSENISITNADGGEPHATGKAHVRVNPAPLAMPTLAELRESALDLGLRGKVVLVTGGSRGIGETTAKLFALHGAKVAINYLHSRTEAERITAEINHDRGQAIAVQADVTNREQVREMVRTVVSKFGTVDVLVNNAVRDFQPIPFLELTWEKMQQDLDVVLKGAFNCCQEVLPLMVKQASGKIINLSTVAVEIPPANQAKYVAAKSALVGLSRSLAVEFARHNIQVNLVEPGFVETGLTQHVGKIFTDRIKQETPLNRLGTPVDVARAIVFLASSLASYTTGQKLMVTGGGPPLF